MSAYPSKDERAARVGCLTNFGTPDNDAHYLATINPGSVVTFVTDTKADEPDIFRGTVSKVDFRTTKAKPSLQVRQYPFNFRLFAWFGTDVTVNTDEILIIE